MATVATIVNPTAVSATLRPGVNFSDGVAFDANAVKFGLQRNAIAHEHGQLNPALEKIVSIDVTGPPALTVHFSAPVAGVSYDQLNPASTYIVSPTAAQRPGANLVASPVEAGPYTLGSYVPDQTITLVKNPSYWDGSSEDIAMLRQIQKLVYHQALEVFSANPPVVAAYDRNVKNLVVNPYYYGGLPILDYWSGVGIAR